MEQMLPIGAKFLKCNSKPSHYHQDGARGTIIGLGQATGIYDGETKSVTEDGYLVEWDGESPGGTPHFIPTHMIRGIGN